LPGYHFDHWTGSGRCWISKDTSQSSYPIENLKDRRKIYIKMANDKNEASDRTITPVFAIGDWPVTVMARSQEDLNMIDAALKSWSAAMQNDEDGPDHDEDVSVCQGYYMSAASNVDESMPSFLDPRDKDSVKAFLSRQADMFVVERIGKLETEIDNGDTTSTLYYYAAGYSSSKYHVCWVAKSRGGGTVIDPPLIDNPDITFTVGHELGHIILSGPNTNKQNHDHVSVSDNVLMPIADRACTIYNLPESCQMGVFKWFKEHLSNAQNIHWNTDEGPTKNIMFFTVEGNIAKFINGAQIPW